MKTGKSAFCSRQASLGSRRITFIGDTAAEVDEAIYRGLFSIIITLGIISCYSFCLDLFCSSTNVWTRLFPSAGLWPTGLMLVGSIALIFVLRGRRISTERMINLGIGYYITFCVMVSYAELITPPPPKIIEEGLSLVCVLIVLFPMFVPTSLRKTLYFSLLAALTGPLTAIAYSIFTDWSLPAGSSWMIHYTPNILSVWLVVRTAKNSIFMESRMKRVRRLGSYELIDLLGKGGMGEVWQATHRLLRRPAAIKLIKPENLSPGGGKNDTSVVARFEREAQATAELHSPHTINLFDFGQTNEGTFYYVMELLDGLNLNEIVEQYGPLNPGRVISILCQVCDSLDDAHQSKLIHRDIKPANIYLCRYGHRVDYVKVLDFGLVKHSGHLGQDETGLTNAGLLTGTPAFIAPETAVNAQVDARSDIYALGCVGYWLLTGQTVFERETSMAMVIAHIQDDPVPPSQQTELPVPAALEALILTCLAKKPADRPQTAQDLADRLQACRCDDDWTASKATEWWNLHRPAQVFPSDQGAESGTK